MPAAKYPSKLPCSTVAGLASKVISQSFSKLSLFLSLPATIALIIGSEQIISALFGYGSFNENSVYNSSLALYYFALGLPAFALIKVFSSFFFANNNTKTPFYISLVSVVLNIFISIYYFKEIGFIIIPIATSISSWFNSILLFIFLKKQKLFYFNQIFFIKFIKIVFATILMGLFFDFLLNFHKPYHIEPAHLLFQYLFLIKLNIQNSHN